MSSSIIALADASFAKALSDSKLPMLVDFWAEWCAPCKALSPILEEIAAEYPGKLQICKLNVDENQVISAKYGIRSIPTLIVFERGEARATKVGVLTKSQLKEFLEPFLVQQ